MAMSLSVFCISILFNHMGQNAEIQMYSNESAQNIMCNRIYLMVNTTQLRISHASLSIPQIYNKQHNCTLYRTWSMMSFTLSCSQSRITRRSFLFSRSWKSERYASSFLSSLRFPTLMAVTCHFFSAAVSRTTCSVVRPAHTELTEGCNTVYIGLKWTFEVVMEKHSNEVSLFCSIS